MKTRDERSLKKQAQIIREGKGREGKRENESKG
jgi:hypothetical protein